MDRIENTGIQVIRTQKAMLFIVTAVITSYETFLLFLFMIMKIRQVWR
jgi:hypothetical protein